MGIFDSYTGYSLREPQSSPADALMEAYAILERAKSPNFGQEDDEESLAGKIAPVVSGNGSSKIESSKLMDRQKAGMVTPPVAPIVEQQDPASIGPATYTGEQAAIPSVQSPVSSGGVSINLGGLISPNAGQGVNAASPSSEQAGGGGLGAIGALAQLASLGASMGPEAAAIIAGGAGTLRGAREGQKIYREGHGKQQEGINSMLGSATNPFQGFNAMLGNPVDPNIMLALNPITAPLWALDQAGINFFSGKGEDQRNRDNLREQLQNIGVIDDNFQIRLSDGSVFDLGQDGSKQIYNIDWSKDVNQDILGAVNPLAHIVANGQGKQASDVAGMLYNAMMSGGDPMKNVQLLYDAFGLDRNSAWHTIDQMVNSGQLDRKTGDAFMAGIDKFWGV